MISNVVLAVLVSVVMFTIAAFIAGLWFYFAVTDFVRGKFIWCGVDICTFACAIAYIIRTFIV